MCPFSSPPQPPPVPQQLGEKAHLRTVAAVIANATGDAGLRRRRLHAGARLAVERRLVQATAVRRSHSSCYYYFYYYTAKKWYRDAAVVRWCRPTLLNSFILVSVDWITITAGNKFDRCTSEFPEEENSVNISDSLWKATRSLRRMSC